MEILKKGDLNKPHQMFLGDCGFCKCQFRCFWQECEFEVGWDPKHPFRYTKSVQNVRGSYG